MKIIKAADESVMTLLGLQDPASVYRRSTFCVFAEADGAMLAYNTLTAELVEISAEEKEVLSRETVTPAPETDEWIRKWFFVPDGTEENILTDEIRTMYRDIAPKKGNNNYTIFPTMDCNARCFYCFELGRPRVKMSDETAEKTAAFILRNCDPDQPVYIDWFGGEPLFHTAPIDRITAELRKAGITFKTRAISNGYLFDDATCERAVRDWNLKSVQISLDGTEAVYNKAKAYIYKDTNAYRIVTDNIGRLLDHDVSVSIRLNLGEHNREDLYALLDELAGRYGARKGLTVYIHALFNTAHKAFFPEDALQAKRLIDEQWALAEHCRERGLRYRWPTLRSRFPLGRCMSDSFGQVTVLPDGHLGKCENYSEDHFVGTVEDGVTDPEMVACFAERANSAASCAGCPWYPDCIRLKMCPDEPEACNEAIRYTTERAKMIAIRETYRRAAKKAEAAKVEAEAAADPAEHEDTAVC